MLHQGSREYAVKMAAFHAYQPMARGVDYLGTVAREGTVDMAFISLGVDEGKNFLVFNKVGPWYSDAYTELVIGSTLFCVLVWVPYSPQPMK